jgi:hypothetical protein
MTYLECLVLLFAFHCEEIVILFGSMLVEVGEDPVDYSRAEVIVPPQLGICVQMLRPSSMRFQWLKVVSTIIE